MLLMKVESQLRDRCIDQVLMVVPDNYDSDKVLKYAREDAGIPEPTITVVARLERQEGFSLDFDEYRIYEG